MRRQKAEKAGKREASLQQLLTLIQHRPNPRRVLWTCLIEHVLVVLVDQMNKGSAATVSMDLEGLCGRRGFDDGKNNFGNALRQLGNGAICLALV